MGTATKKSEAEATADLEKSQLEEIADAEIIVNRRSGSGAPFSVRLSPPLLDRLDQLARNQNRKRGNLIQTILWDYVHSHPLT
jgi:hypothetical protein